MGKEPRRIPQQFLGLFLLNLGLFYGGAIGCGDNAAPPAPPAPTLQSNLSVNVGGAGAGSVSSDSGGIDCRKADGTCEDSLDQGTQVTLTAVPDAGYFFNGWQGACSGITPCTLTLDQDLDVSASFVNIAFYSTRALDGSDATNAPNGTYNLWTINSDGTNAQARTNLTGASAESLVPQWSPDGNRLLFFSNRNLNNQAPDAPSNGRSNLWVLNAAGDGASMSLTNLIAPNGTINFFPPSWSPDGTQATYACNRNLTDLSAGAPANPTSNVWITNTDGSGGDLALTQLTGATAFHPQWSPEGTKIVYASDRNLTDLDPSAPPNTTENIWVVNADGSGGDLAVTQITADAGSINPQWSPDGTRVVYLSMRNLNDLSPSAPANIVFNIWVSNADGSEAMPLTRVESNANNNSPQWSPDGSQIIFHSTMNLTDPDPNATSNFRSNVWSVRSDGSEDPLPLTTLVNISTLFGFYSPDASAIIFDSNRNLDPNIDGPNLNNTGNIWIMNPDGSGELPVTELTSQGTSSFGPFTLD